MYYCNICHTPLEGNTCPMCKNVFEDTTDDNNVVSLPDFDTFHEGLIIDLGVNFHMDIKGIYDHIKNKYTSKNMEE
jgi:hypothetical protein